VVHARAGKRADYRLLETPFGLADDPVAIARALLAVTDSPILYVADLDPIAGTGHPEERRLGAPSSGRLAARAHLSLLLGHRNWPNSTEPCGISRNGIAE
jgi:hypothetical protein